MRSRTRSLPRLAWRARASSLPPRVALASLLAQLLDQALHGRGFARKVGRLGIDRRRKNRHRQPRLFTFEQFAPDQHAPDLAGAGADLIELGIAQQPAGRIVVGIAVAAEQLDRVERHAGRVLRRVEDRAGGILARGLAAVAGSRHRIDVGPAGIHRDIHVGDLALHQLELADRLAELLALVDIGQHHIQAGLHDAERARRQHHAFVVEARTSAY